MIVTIVSMCFLQIMTKSARNQIKKISSEISEQQATEIDYTK